MLYQLGAEFLFRDNQSGTFAGLLFTDRICSAYEIRYFGRGVVGGNSTRLVA
ncbi:MAG: hypothetical protein ACLPVO_01410 [Desulfomonilaceae bacterium]